MLLQPQAPGCEDARANRNLLYVVAIFFITMPSAGTLYPNKLKAFTKCSEDQKTCVNNRADLIHCLLHALILMWWIP